MDSKTILSKIDRIRDLPTLPFVALEVNRLFEDPDASLSVVSQVIEKDPSIAMKILKLVNSAFYGCRSSVSTLSKAIMLLGFNTVRNAVLSVSVIETFSEADDLEGFKVNDFWRHSVGVAVISKKLAELTRVQAPDNCFVAGLLHDIGKVILSQYFKDVFKKIWTTSRIDNLSFYAAEKKEIQIEHAMIGSHLAKKWALPEDLVDTIRCHHAVREDVDNYKLLVIVHVADFIINHHNPGLDSPVDISASRINSEMSEILQPHIVGISEWYPDLIPDIEAACSFFLDER